eukprot:CAMPEP_0174254436 /NCGR_PEP_ID=MMETSP0439-20130205/3755_1 /TAXON_ID=0 /ORGANISM="Stereomyxa ramosa, Strain Chinc5" /LENGTH=218 /DNA_ID=CAMNT_0015336015 /DNA_START=133 /DNA_END=789 /DNA_ORIENTATION=-
MEKNDPDLRSVKLQQLSPQEKEKFFSCLESVFKNNTNLRELNLCQNSFGDDEVCKIAKALKENKGIRILDLSFNLISDRGGWALVSALEDNNSLTSLFVVKNNLCQGITDAISRGLQKNILLSENTVTETVGTLAPSISALASKNYVYDDYDEYCYDSGDMYDFYSDGNCYSGDESELGSQQLMDFDLDDTCDLSEEFENLDPEEELLDNLNLFAIKH